MGFPAIIVVVGLALLTVAIGGEAATYLVIGGALYFLPAIVAATREHHNAAAIFVLNLLLGWSGLGWIGALVWSCTAVRPTEQPAQASSSSRTAIPRSREPRTGADSFAVAILAGFGIAAGILLIILLA